MMLAILLAVALHGTGDEAAATHAARLLHAAHPKQVDLAAHTYAGRCLAAVSSLEVGGGRELLLVETEAVGGTFQGGQERGLAEGGCDPDVFRGQHAWSLELVQGTPARAKLLGHVEVGADPGAGGVQAGLARLAREPLLVEVDWGLSNESDGACSRRDVWRIREAKLERLLSFSACSSGDGPEGGSSTSGFSVAPAVAGEVRVDATQDVDEYSEDQPGWSARTTGTYLVGERTVIVPHALASASASSALPPSAAGDYRPERAIDGDPKTAWCEGAAGPGVGQSFTLSFDPPMAVTAVTILPGYGKSPTVFQANARPRRVRIEAGTAPAVERELRGAFEPQRLELVPGPPTASVKLTVLSVWPGGRFADVCISEISAEGRF